MCIEKINFKKAKLVIVCEDASDNTKEDFVRLAEKNNIKIYIFGEKEILSQKIGKNNKVVVAILDENFAKSIVKMLEDLKEAIC